MLILRYRACPFSQSLFYSLYSSAARRCAVSVRLYYFRGVGSALGREDEMSGVSARQTKLVDLVCHIYRHRIEDDASVSVALPYGEADALSVAESQSAAFAGAA